MIEVLVALIILAIGLLGLASLHAVGLRNNHSAYLRTQASMLAYSMVDRIRANQEWANVPGNWRQYAYNYRRVDSITELHTECMQIAGCGQERLAENDLLEWKTTVQSVLPGGNGIVCTDSNLTDGTECDFLGDTYVIRIQWTDESTGAITRFVTTFKRPL